MAKMSQRQASALSAVRERTVTWVSHPGGEYTYMAGGDGLPVEHIDGRTMRSLMERGCVRRVIPRGAPYHDRHGVVRAVEGVSHGVE